MKKLLWVLGGIAGLGAIVLAAKKLSPGWVPPKGTQVKVERHSIDYARDYIVRTIQGASGLLWRVFDDPRLNPEVRVVTSTVPELAADKNFGDEYIVLRIDRKTGNPTTKRPTLVVSDVSSGAPIISKATVEHNRSLSVRQRVYDTALADLGLGGAA